MFNKRNTYNEGVSIGHLFVLTDVNNNPKNLPCFCKDYFQDYFWTLFTKKPVKIYGYQTVVEDVQEKYRFYIRLGDKSQHQGTGYKSFTLKGIQVITLRRFLRDLSIALNLSIPKCLANEDEIFIEFDSNWFKYPYLLSLLTSAIRIGTYMSFDEFIKTKHEELSNQMCLYVQDLKKNNYEQVQSKLQYLIKNGLPEVKWEDYDQNSIHNSSGIQSVKFK